MKLYTFIMEFRGGTYVSQVKSPNVEAAALEWAKNIPVKDMQHIGQQSKNELVALMNEPEPTLLIGMDNVWCITGLLKIGFFMVHVIGCP